MQRVGEEKFSSSPLVYSSTFSVSSHVLKGRTGIVTSDRSGLGWSFRLVKSSTSTESSKNGGNGSWDGRKSVNVPTDSRDSPVAPSKPPPPPARPSSSPDTVGKARVTLCMEPWVVLLSNCMTIRKITCEVNSNSRVVSLLTKESLPLSSTIELGTFKYDLPPQGINTSYLILYTTIELFQNAESSPKDIRSLAVSTISDSIESGESPDVKFVLYTKRSRPHGASSPKAVFAMSFVLYAYGCNDLNLFFTAGGFKCSEVVAVDLYHPTSEDKRTNDYEYDSDSDLEDEDESSLPISEFPPSNEVNGDRKHPQAGESNKDGDSTSTNSLTVLERLKTIEAEENIKFLRTGRIVFIRDTAYKTWKALVKYIYFDEIQFNQLLSSYPPKSCASGCSPKSMYRVADKFGILPLQKLALKSIKSQLSTTNIGREVFSRFTSWYPEVAEIEVAFVLENYSSGEVRQSVMQAVENIGTGDYAHAVHALKKILNGLQAIPTPPSISVPPKPRPKPTATPVPIGQNQ